MRTRRYILVLAILCFALVLSVPAVVSATLLPSTDAECVECHGTGSAVTDVTVDFSVGSVNKATACQKCHWISPHPQHTWIDTRTSICVGCHSVWDWGRRTDFWVSQTTLDANATGSYFNSDLSVYTSSDELHRIHTRRSWIAEAANYQLKCAGCHAAASCDACHEPLTAHGAHGVDGDTGVGDPTVPVTSNLTRGIPVGATTSPWDYTFYGQSACIASGCHAGVAPGYFIDDAEFTYSAGDWKTIVAPSIVGGSYTYSSSVTASFTVTFTGTGIAWVGQRMNTGGIAEVYIDGVLKKTADSYFGKSGPDRHIAVVLGLSYGEHTLTVKNTSRTFYLWNDIFVQGIRVYGEKPDFVAAPDCAGCHDQHGDLTDKHTSTWSMDGCKDSGCHLTNELAAEHDQWRPETENTCALCHGAAVSSTVAGAVDGGVTACDACHTETNHHSLHNAASVMQKGCKSCHSTYLDTEHANRGHTCAVCHDTDDPRTVAAVAAGDLRCTSCHGSNPHSTR
ncbi:MAG: hypothetical protein U1F44_03045 [Coriobacteriia bacterium]|nr:hypothetical protein [Coriobacteriia bacterium]